MEVVFEDFDPKEPVFIELILSKADIHSIREGEMVRDEKVINGRLHHIAAYSQEPSSFPEWWE